MDNTSMAGFDNSNTLFIAKNDKIITNTTIGMTI